MTQTQILFFVQAINDLYIVLTSFKKPYIYVVVNFLFQVIFDFLLFLGMVIYANEVETKEKQKLPEIKN